MNRYTFSYSPWEDLDFIDSYFHNKKLLKPKIIELIKNFLEKYRNKPQSPMYMYINKNKNQINTYTFYRFLRYCYRYWISGVYKDDHTKLNPFKKLMKELSFLIRKYYQLKFINWDEINFKDNYVYFPLHVQPEASTMTLAPFYLNQLYIIENLSKSLPINMKLVVKEHPNMIGKRETNYYLKIKKLPNVYVINPFYNNFELIKNSKLIFTITGTAGLEGLIFKKPVIVLGNAYYRYCPLAVFAGDIPPTKWPDLIFKLLKSYDHNEEDLIKFFGAIYENSFEAIIMEPLSDPELILSKKNVEIISKEIEKILNVNN